MKKLFLFLFLCFSSIAFGQIDMKWEALLAQNGSNSFPLHQTSQGYLITLIPSSNEILISKDNAKTWQTISFLNVLPKYYYRSKFRTDEFGDTYFFDESNIYKLDIPTNSFKVFFNPKLSIDDVNFAHGKIYVGGFNNLNIYNFSDLKQIFTKTWLTNSVHFIMGKNNKNYVVTSLGATDYWNSFADNGSAFIEYGEKSGLDYDNIFLLTSGRLITRHYDGLLISDDKGVSWTIPVLNKNIDQIWVNSKNEIVIADYENALSISNDEGKTWAKIPLPNKEYSSNFIFMNNKESEIVLMPSNCNVNKIYFTTDKGKSWKSETSLLDKPISRGIAIIGQNDVLTRNCVYFDAIKRSTMPSWEYIGIKDSIPFNDFCIFPSGKCMAYSPIDNNYYTTTNSGKSWSLFTNPNINPLKTENRLHYTQKGELLYIDSDKYFISKDEGISWKGINAPGIYSSNIYKIGKALVFDGNIFFEGLYNWSKINYYNASEKKLESLSSINNNSVNSITFPIHLGYNRICCLTTTNANHISLNISDDFGKTFTVKPLSTSISSNFIDFIIDANSNLILITSDGIYMSYDEGDSWKSMKGNLPQDIQYSAIAISPDQYLYVGTTGGPIYKSKTPLSKTNKVQGAVFGDLNNNCIKDANEPYLKNIKVELDASNTSTRVTDDKGFFNFNVFDGTYQLSTQANENTFSPCAAAYTAQVSAAKDSFYIDIPLKIKKYCADLSVSLGSTLPLRRCFSNTYYGKVCNDGSKEAKNTKITIQLDSLFDFESASLPVVSLVNQTLILDAGTVDYGDCQNFSIKFKVSCKSALGQEHCISLAVSSPDACGNEQPGAQAKPYLECKKNVGSYDPNDKTAFVDGCQSTTQVKAGQKIEYLVRFQNTGTDTAFNIVVKDPIHKNLDVSSIVMGASSHTYTWEVRENVLSVTFKNIMLPDSNVNEKTSHGFFKFLIQPKSNVTVKDLVTNTAAIYFDFNEPIFTNEATLNKKTIKTNEIQRGVDFLLYPNPATEQITLELPEQLEGESNALLYSVDGRLLTKKTNVQNTSIFDVRNLPKGIYFIHVKNKTQFGVKKFVKE